ncbi:hypothetical protein BHM03_00050080, partial [Ensete ventricosum]
LQCVSLSVHDAGVAQWSCLRQWCDSQLCKQKLDPVTATCAPPLPCDERRSLFTKINTLLGKVAANPERHGSENPCNLWIRVMGRQDRWIEMAESGRRLVEQVVACTTQTGGVMKTKTSAINDTVRKEMTVGLVP